MRSLILMAMVLSSALFAQAEVRSVQYMQYRADMCSDRAYKAASPLLQANRQKFPNYEVFIHNHLARSLRSWSDNQQELIYTFFIFPFYCEGRNGSRSCQVSMDYVGEIRVRLGTDNCALLSPANISIGTP